MILYMSEFVVSSVQKLLMLWRDCPELWGWWWGETEERLGGGEQVDREEAGGRIQTERGVVWRGLYSCCTLYVTPSLYFRVWSSSSQQQQVAPLIILRCFRLSWHQTSLVSRQMWGLRWTMDFSSSSGRWREARMQWAGGSSDCDPILYNYHHAERQAGGSQGCKYLRFVSQKNFQMLDRLRLLR